MAANSKTDVWETALLNLVFKNTDCTLIGDAGGLRGSVTPGSLYISLHTADPTDTGIQTSSEAAYVGYARVAVTRGAGFTVTGGSVSPTANIDFGECTATPGTAITHFGIGTDASGGAGKLLYCGTVTSNITMAVGVIPRLTTATAVTED